MTTTIKRKTMPGIGRVLSHIAPLKFMLTMSEGKRGMVKVVNDAMFDDQLSVVRFFGIAFSCVFWLG
jgi:hypothetical protein